MAAAAMEPVRPVIRTINIKANSGQPRSLDPVILSQKLEAARREQDAANTRRERRLATRNGTFVARSNTHSSDSSTTPPVMTPQNNAPNPLAMNPPTRISPSVAKHAQSIMDGRPVMTHKSMFAALNLGLADLEAMTERLEQETTKQREFLCSRCKTPEVQPGQHDHPIDNYSRRKSLPASSARHEHVSQQPAYDCFELPADDPPQYHAISYRASEDVPRTFAQRSPPAFRPHPQPLDQQDWSPQSQNSANDESRENLFNVPSGYIFRRRNKDGPAASGVDATRNPTTNAPATPPQQEMHLISDAVKLIKAKERQRRRKSVIDFLKKL